MTPISAMNALIPICMLSIFFGVIAYRIYLNRKKLK